MSKSKEILSKAQDEHQLTHDEICYLLRDNNFELIKERSKQTKEKEGPNGVHLKALIEFSNICSRECLYCGLRKQNKSIQRYKLQSEQILDLARESIDCGYKTIVLQSGESSAYHLEELVEIIKAIKKLGVSITLSIGEKTRDEYIAYKKAGADRFLLRIETTDSKLYKALHPNMSHQNRFECLKILKELHYEVGSGGLVGLPNQSIESIANDILFYQSMDVDMVGIGPFLPSQNTPLRDAKKASFELAFKTMCLTRILMPQINMPATTAIENLQPNGRELALEYFANVVMPIVTKNSYKELYQLYPRKSEGDNIFENKEKIIKMIECIGGYVSSSNGNSLRFEKRKEY